MNSTGRAASPARFSFEVMSMSSTVNWLDPGVPGVEIRIQEYTNPAGSVTRAVFVRAPAALADQSINALTKAGFRPSRREPHSFFRPGTTFKLLEMKAAFPAVKQVSVPREQTLEVVPAGQAASPQPDPTAQPKPDHHRGPPATSPAPHSARSMMRPGGRVAVEPLPPAAVSLAAPEVEPSALAAAAVPPPGRATGMRRMAVRPVPPRTATAAAPEPVEVFIRNGREEWGGDRVNAFQVRYRPRSQVGTPVATIPVNLALATEAALLRVEAEYGQIDEFVAGRLGWTVEELGTFLSPEQVDAVALAIAAADRGQGFVLADQTGLGKGRVVAAIARAIVLSGSPAVVITEKENLFSDLFRDIGDIGSLELFGRPFILNDGAEIVDTASAERKVIYPAWKKQQVQEVLKTSALPDGVKLVLATYTQFNRRGSPKAALLKAIATGSHVVCDESHNAVGDSATSEVLADAMDLATAVTYSSATFARNAKNLSAYRRLFPASMQSSDLMSVLSSGGQAISEALSQMLAEDGGYLRREHDLSDIKIEVLDDSSRLERNRAFADALSPILARVAKISRSVSELADDRNAANGEDGGKKSSRETWYTGNFGARLGVVVRQFVTALLVDLCVEEAVDALQKGEKPVIVIESTMESLMRELAEDDGVEHELDGDEQNPLAETADLEAAVELVGKAPDFRDALRLLVDRTMMLMVRRAGADEPERLAVEEPDLVVEADALRALIDGFPDLPLSPIDDVRARVEAHGRGLAEAGAIQAAWVADEISARGMRVVDGAYQAMPAQDRVRSVATFNAGLSDCLVITRAASTGLSLHSSEKVKDQRRRRMIELQIPSNVVERVQFWGRVNRRGQVNTPAFRTLSTALPLQTRQLAIQNRKVADLSANVTASAESASAMDVPDMLDAVGNAVCRRILEERPSLADRMHIALKLQDMEKAETELYHVNKFLQRMVLLPAREQDTLYAEALTAYEDALRDLSARGKSPRGARELEGSWRVVDRSLYEAGDVQDGPVFGRPVTVTTIESEKELAPWSSSRVLEAIAASTTRILGAPNGATTAMFATQLKTIVDNRPAILQAALSKYYMNIKQALADSKSNAVKDADTRIARLVSLLQTVRPGHLIEVMGDEGRETGVITDIRPPRDLREAHLPGRWSFRYVMPGDESAREISAASIIRDATTVVRSPGASIAPGLLSLYDRAPSGRVTVRRKILDGNLVRAVMAARNAGWGSAVTWADDLGAPHRAILVPKNRQHNLHLLPGRLTNAQIAASLLKAGAEIWTNPDDPDSGASIRLAGSTVQLTIPGSKRLSKLFEGEEITAVTGKFRGDHRSKSAEMPVERLDDLCVCLAVNGHAFHYAGQYRPMVAELFQSQLALDADTNPSAPAPR